MTLPKVLHSIESPKLLERITPKQEKRWAKAKIFSLLIGGLGAVLSLYVYYSSDLAENWKELLLKSEVFLSIIFVSAVLLSYPLLETGWRKFAFWLSFGLISQTISLQLVNAGNLIHFQNYRTLSDQLNKNADLLVFLLIQAVVVVAGIFANRTAIKNFLAARFNFLQLFAIGICLFLSGAAVTPDYTVYLNSLFFSFGIQIIGLANILLIVLAIPAEFVAKAQMFFERKINAERNRKFVWTFVIGASLWIVLLSAALNFFIYEREAHVPDETQYLFQAEYLAAGKAAVKAPPVPEVFAMYMVPYREEYFFGIFPPAFPAVLAIGEKFGAVWFINPLLAGLCIVLTYLFFREIYSAKFALIAVFLLGFSPWFIFMAMSFMSHIFSLAASLAAAVATLKFRKNNSIKYLLGSAAMVGVVGLIRPLDGLIVFFLLATLIVLQAVRIKAKVLNLFIFTSVFVVTSALIFPYNKAVTGSFTLLPMDFYYDNYFRKGVMSLGFGIDRGFDWGLDAFPGHSPFEAVLNASLNVFSVNTELFGWMTGSLIFVLIFVFSKSPAKRDLWAWLTIFTVISAYALYWYHGGPDFGARYWFLCIIPFVGLTVRGMENFSLQPKKAGNMDARIVLAVIILAAFTLVNYLPWRAFDKYHNYLGIRADISQMKRNYDWRNALILIRGAESPDYQAAWIHNPLDFETDAPIFAHDKTAELRKRLFEAYPERTVWIINGPTVTGRGYEISGVPMKAADLLKKEQFAEGF